jgi:hypothetical protein
LLSDIASSGSIAETFAETNESIAAAFNAQKANPDFVAKAKSFQPKEGRSPSFTMIGELMRNVFLDSKMQFSARDASDIQHTVISTTYCDYVLLDGKWEHMLEAATRRVAEMSLPFRPAQCFSARRGGLLRFIETLEAYSPPGR